jgi:hypothetical protein
MCGDSLCSSHVAISRSPEETTCRIQDVVWLLRWQRLCRASLHSRQPVISLLVTLCVLKDFCCRLSWCRSPSEQGEDTDGGDEDGSGDRDNGVEGINEGVADLSSEDGAVADLQCDNVVQHSGLVQGHRKHSNTGTVHLFTLLLTN